MADDASETTLQKVDSKVQDAKEKVLKKTTSGGSAKDGAAAEVHNINDLEKEGAEIKIHPETQRLNWKMNTSPATIDDKEALKKPLCTPLIKKIDLVFPLGSEVTARNLKGVTIKDALDAIYKQYKKKADDEFENPFLAGFEWDKEESYTKFKVHQKATGDAPAGKKKKGKAAEEE